MKNSEEFVNLIQAAVKLTTLQDNPNCHDSYEINLAEAEEEFRLACDLLITPVL